MPLHRRRSTSSSQARPSRRAQTPIHDGNSEDVDGVIASIEDGVATVELSVDLPNEPLAQVVTRSRNS
jgi:hypothetical protein